MGWRIQTTILLLEFYTYGLANSYNNCWSSMGWRIQTTIVGVLYLWFGEFKQQIVGVLYLWVGEFTQQLLEFYTYGLANSNNNCCSCGLNMFYKLTYGLANSNNNCWIRSSKLTYVCGRLFQNEEYSHTQASFLEQGIFTCLFICVRDVGETAILDVGEQTVGETTGYRCRSIFAMAISRSSLVTNHCSTDHQKHFSKS